MDTPLPFIPNIETIKKRLPLIFPEGIDQRGFLVRDMSASTIFVMFYVGAIEGSDRWVRPAQVTIMTDEQAAMTSTYERLQWINNSLSPGKLKDIKGTWYAANTREPIRDETIKNGLIATGAVIEKAGLPTTSSAPRYALSQSFANLFEEGISEAEIVSRIDNWQEKFLNTGAIARIKLIKRGSTSSTEGVIVTFPNGESRRMSPGPSSFISKNVIEIFAKKFLINPALIFLSESGNKVIAQDNALANSIGLKIEADKNLPDIILADLGTPSPLIIFIEVVFSDGPITPLRKSALLKLAVDAGFNKDHVVFVSAFSDKDATVFKRLSSQLAWGSFVWFSSEPDNILIYKDQEQLETKKLFDLI
jgi:hypothetical protein